MKIGDTFYSPRLDKILLYRGGRGSSGASFIIGRKTNARSFYQDDGKMEVSEIITDEHYFTAYSSSIFKKMVYLGNLIDDMSKPDAKYYKLPFGWQISITRRPKGTVRRII